MNYIYDVFLNFKYPLYDFFDWNSDDDYSHVRKAPVYKVGSDNLQIMKESYFKIDEKFLKQVYQKTEMFTDKKVGVITYACIFVSDNEAVAFKFNNKGYVTQKSYLVIDEEAEVLEFSECFDPLDINYEVIRKDRKDLYLTRYESDMKRYIVKEISNLISNKEVDKIKYLYYECFNKPISSTKDPGKQLYEALEHNFDSISYKMYDFFKLCQTQK